MVCVEVSVDIYLGLQPCYEERAVAGACLLKDVGGQQSRRDLLRVDAVLNAAQVFFVVVVEETTLILTPWEPCPPPAVQNWWVSVRVKWRRAVFMLSGENPGILKSAGWSRTTAACHASEV